MPIKDIYREVKGAIGSLVEVGKGAYETVDKNLWVLLPALGVVGGMGAIKMLTPKAVSDNADKYVVNEALKSSLAESIRRQEMLQRNKEAEEAYSNVRKHDRFV